MFFFFFSSVFLVVILPESIAFFFMRDIVVNDEKCQKKANKIHPETNNIIFFCSRMYSELPYSRHHNSQPVFFSLLDLKAGLSLEKIRS